MINEQRMVWLIAFGLGGVLLYILAPVLTPFIASALLAYLGDPLADRLEAMRLPRPVAVICVFFLTILVLVLLVLLLLPLVRSQVSALIDVLPRYLEFVENQVWPKVAGFIGESAEGTEFGLSAMIEQFGANAAGWGSTFLASIGRSSGALINAVVNIFLIPILTFYLLRDWDSIIARIGALVPSANRQVVHSLALQTDETLGAFLRGQLLVMIGLAAIYTLGLSVIGLKFALAIGVVSGLVSFVPYLGLVFGLTLAGLTALNSPDSGLMLALVAVVFILAQFLEGSVLTPKLVGDRIGLHPVLVIFAVMAFGQLFGFFGVLLALPAAAVIAVVVRFFYDRYLREHPEAEAYLDQLDGDSSADDEKLPTAADDAENAG